MSSQNAISTLLQPPILRTGLLPHAAFHSASQTPPTSRGIPPVTLTNISHVEDSAFQDYLGRIGSLLDTIQRAKLASEDSGAEELHNDNSTNKDVKLAPHGRQKTSDPKHGPLAPTKLSAIPSVYFDENFRLENPRTFDAVMEHVAVVWQPLSMKGDGSEGADGTATNGTSQPVEKTLSTNAILQEKLSWYMDTVEMHIISSISQMLASFFVALGSLREVQARAVDSVAKIRELRWNLALLDKGMVLPGAQIVSMKRKRNNVRKLGEAIKQLRCVCNGATHCEELVNSGQLETAMHHISHVEQLAYGTLDQNMRGELHWLLPDLPPGLINLRQLHVVRGLLQGISQLRLRIGKGYEARMLDVLLCDLRQHLSSIPPRDTLARWVDGTNRARSASDACSSISAHMVTAESLREELIPILQGLSYSQYLGVASTTFRESVMREMKSLIRQHLPFTTEEDNDSVASASTQDSSRRPSQEEKLRVLSRNLRDLSPRDAQMLFVNVYCGIGEALRRLAVQVKVLLDITSSVKTPDSVFAPVRSPVSVGDSAVRFSRLAMVDRPQEETMKAFDTASLLEQAAEKAQSETTKILRVRTEQTIHLGLTDLLRHLMLNRFFVNECEAVSGHSGAALKDAVNKQIHDFLPLMHESQKQLLAHKMLSERWERIDFKPEDAVILGHIVKSMSADPPAWLMHTNDFTADLEAGEKNSHTDDTPAELASTAKQDRKGPLPAIIEEDKFMLVNSTAFALRGIEQYAILLVSIPSIANDISTILLDYLKLYNSRTQQLILGAGAKLTAGLTNINTRHLALASQSLSFFVTLIPCLREFVRRRLSITSSSMAEYDRLKRVFQDHQSSIHEKLIDIMTSRATACVRAMEKIKWDDEDEAQRNVSPHMETLTKEALVLERVLSKYLPADQVRMIVGQVFENFRAQLGKAFEDVTIMTEVGRARLLRDGELLEAKIGQIDGVEEFGTQMINIVKAKQIASRPKQKHERAIR